MGSGRPLHSSSGVSTLCSRILRLAHRALVVDVVARPSCVSAASQQVGQKERRAKSGLTISLHEGSGEVAISDRPPDGTISGVKAWDSANKQPVCR